MNQETWTAVRRLLVLQVLFAGLAIWAATFTIYVYNDGADGTIRARAFGSAYALLRGGPYIVPLLLLVGCVAVTMLLARRLWTWTVTTEIVLLALYVVPFAFAMFSINDGAQRFLGYNGTTSSLGFVFLFSLSVACLIASVRLREIVGRHAVRVVSASFVLLVLALAFAMVWLVVQATTNYDAGGASCGTLLDHDATEMCTAAAHSLVIEAAPVVVLAVGLLVALALVPLRRWSRATDAEEVPPRLESRALISAWCASVVVLVTAVVALSHGFYDFGAIATWLVLAVPAIAIIAVGFWPRGRRVVLIATGATAGALLVASLLVVTLTPPGQQGLRDSLDQIDPPSGMTFFYDSAYGCPGVCLDDRAGLIRNYRSTNAIAPSDAVDHVVTQFRRHDFTVVRWESTRNGPEAEVDRGDVCVRVNLYGTSGSTESQMELNARAC